MVDEPDVPEEVAALIRELVDEIAFAIVQDRSFAKTIEKAVKNGYEIHFIPSPDPVAEDEVNIRLKVRKEIDLRWFQQDVYIRTEHIGMVA